MLTTHAAVKQPLSWALCEKNMFWKKHYLTDANLGKLEWALDHWLSVETVNEVSLSLQGSKTEFEPTSLEQANQLLESKDRVLAAAVSYLTKKKRRSLFKNGDP